MSKLLKSKFLLGVVVVAVMFVGVVAVSATPAAADCSITMTLRVGSTGTQVACLQTVVGATADGKFGPLTKASVMAWQSGHGLVADGVFGPKSNAVLMALGTTGGSYPAGCTSNSGFSSTTGASCATGATGPCTGGALFNSVTGASCSSTLPAGCTTTAGFSPTTGVSCSGVVVVPISATGEGSLAVSYDAIPANSTTVNKGEEKAVMAIKLKATGSDMKVTRVWLDIGTRAWLSADKVTLLDGSTVLSELPLSASTVTELVAGSSYQLQFNNLNVTVPVGTTKVLTFKVSRPALTTANADVVVAITSSVRAVDMAGITNTYAFTTLGTRTWDMTAVSATTGTLTTALSASSPAAQSISGLSATASVVTAVKLADINFKGEDSAINITQLVATIAATSGTEAYAVAAVELRDGTNVLSSVALSTHTATFPSLSIDVAKDTTKVLSIWAQMNPIADADADGYTVKGAGFTATLTSASTVATDAGYATVTVSSANVVGNAQYMFQYAPTLALVSSSAANTGIDNKDGTYSLAFSVTAPSDRDIYVDADGATLTAVAKTVSAKGGTIADSITASGTTSRGAVATAFDKVAAGTSRTFTVTGYVPAGGQAGFTGIKVVNVTWTDTDHATDPAPITQTWGVSSLKTAEVYVKAS